MKPVLGTGFINDWPIADRPARGFPEPGRAEPYAVLPWLGAATCFGLAVQQVVEDPKLALWAGGLLAFGLILWTIERAVR